MSRVDARYLIGFGFVMLSGSLFYMTSHLYEGIDFRTAVQLRIIQSIGLPFLFIPINTLVYAGVPPEKNNAVSGIVNLSRNMGGDIGIAFVTTLIARRQQFHQDVLVARASNYDPTFTARIAGLARTFERAGASTVEASKKAMALIYFQVQHQAADPGLSGRAEVAGGRHRADGPLAVPDPTRPPRRRAGRPLTGRPRTSAGQREIEGRARPGRRLGPDAPLVPAHDPMNDGEPDAGPGKLGAVQALEWLEQLARVGRIEPDPVVLDEIGCRPVRGSLTELDAGCAWARVNFHAFRKRFSSTIRSSRASPVADTPGAQTSSTGRASSSRSSRRTAVASADRSTT